MVHIDKIVKVWCSKPKENKVLIVHITRECGPHVNSEVICASKFTKNGYSEWEEKVNDVSNIKTGLCQELRNIVGKLMEMVQS